MLKILIAVILILSSCSKSKNYEDGYSTPQLVEVVNEFEDVFSTKVHYPVLFVAKFTDQTSADQMGICYHDGRVEISELIDDARLKVVVFHELAHCSFGAHHYDDTLDIMNSKMNPYVALQAEDKYIPQMLENFHDGKY